MNRAIPIVCLVGLIFAVGALANNTPAAANDEIVKAEEAALAKESEVLTKLAGMYNSDPRSMSVTERHYNPTISHLIRSVEHTRRLIITDALEMNWKEPVTFKQDLTDAHANAYKAVNMELVELSKALAAIDDRQYAVSQIEELLLNRIKQVERY